MSGSLGSIRWPSDVASMCLRLAPTCPLRGISTPRETSRVALSSGGMSAIAEVQDVVLKWFTRNQVARVPGPRLRDMGAEHVVKAKRHHGAGADATLAIARSGSGVSEFAMARLPSILVPLPSSADNHQFRNAQEFEQMGAATIANQETCTVEELASQINVWLKDKNKQESAAHALSEWDMPNATFHIWSEVKNAAQ